MTIKPILIKPLEPVNSGSFDMNLNSLQAVNSGINAMVAFSNQSSKDMSSLVNGKVDTILSNTNMIQNSLMSGFITSLNNMSQNTNNILNNLFYSTNRTINDMTRNTDLIVQSKVEQLNKQMSFDASQKIINDNIIAGKTEAKLDKIAQVMDKNNVLLDKTLKDKLDKLVSAYQSEQEKNRQEARKDDEPPNPIIEFLESILANGMEAYGLGAIPEFTTGIFDTLIYLSERIRDFGKFFDRLQSQDYDSIEEIQEDLFGGKEVSNFATFFFGVFFVLPLLKDIGSAIYAPSFVNLQQLALKSSSPNIPDFRDLYDLFIRNELDKDELEDLAMKKGYSKELIDKMKRSLRRIPDLSMIFELFRRGEIEEQNVINFIRILGYDETYSEIIKDLAFYVPPPPDVIRFAVRDVFDSELAELSGLFEGWDNPEFLENAARAGLKPEIAKLYWGSHWVLPSSQQGFEMYQREKITRQELEALLRAADFAPNWRDKLLSISYNMPTRVDVRRAYEDGIINDNELLEYIRQSGVEPRWIDPIFRWHKQRKLKIEQSQVTAKTLSVSQIIRGYNNGVFQQSETVRELEKLGYSTQDAILLIKVYEENVLKKDNEKFTTQLRDEMRKMGIEGYRSRSLSRLDAKDLIRQSGINETVTEAMLSLLDKQYEIDRKAEIVNAVRKLFIGYEISENTFYATLNKNGFSQSEIENHLIDIRPLRDLRFRELTRTDIKKGAINPELGIEWGKEKLRGLGYSEETIREIMIIEQWEDTQNSISI